MKHPLSAAAALVLVLLASCEQVIPWDTEQLPVMLVVEGSFTNEYKTHRVMLSLSEDYFYNKPTPKVSGATVSISDGSNLIGMTERPPGSGIYVTTGKVAGIPGRTYTLSIDLEEPVNGERHYEATEKMVPGLEIDSVFASIYKNPLSFEDRDSLLVIITVLGQDPPETENYYQMNLYINDRLIQDTIDEVTVLDDKEGINGHYVSSFFFIEQADPGDTLRFEMVSVGRDYYDFVNSVRDLANQSFDPFDLTGPPANAIGNIEGAPATGFFRVGSVSSGTNIARYSEDE